MEFKRGQVWYVRYDDSIGDEMAVGRAVLIISKDEDIRDLNTVICVFMTSGLRRSKNVVTTFFNGKKQYIHCGQIHTFDKQRLTEYIGDLGERSMLEVDRVTYCATHNAELEELQKVENKNDNDYVDVLVERDMYKKLYEKTLDKIIEVQLQKSQEEKVVEKIVEVEVEKIVEVEVEKIVEVEKVVEVEKIVEVPRELTEEEVLEWIDKLESKNENIEPEVTEEVVVEPEKVEVKKRGAKVKHGMGKNPTREQIDEFKKDGKANLNTDEWWVIAATTGMSRTAAQRIVAYRKKVGKFKRVKDLMNVDFVKASFIEKYGSMLEV